MAGYAQGAAMFFDGLKWVGTRDHIPLTEGRQLTKGYHHVFGNWQHDIRGGRGIFGSHWHWECRNPNCSCFDNAFMWSTIVAVPACSQQCQKCGDWAYNNRERCPIKS